MEFTDDDLAAEEENRKAVEKRLAEHYSIPVEAFSAGSGTDCVLVCSYRAFELAARKLQTGYLYLMPYLPPSDALKIKVEMEKEPWLHGVIINPELLSYKVAAMEEISAKVENARALLADPEKQDEARARREQMELYRLASDLIQFRHHMRYRLLFAYAAQGNWGITRSFLNLLCPGDNSTIQMTGDHGNEELKWTIRTRKSMYPYHVKADADGLISDLMSVLSLERWIEQLLKAPSQMESRIAYFEEVGMEATLIGSSNISLAVIASKSQLDALLTLALSEGHFAEGFRLSAATKSDAHELQMVGHEQINRLITLLEKTRLNFEDMSATIEVLNLSATKCKKILNEVQSAHIAVCYRLDLICELHELVGLLESRVQKGP